jgi:hypothetical protein
VARQRGLRHVQAFGRSADMAFFRHRQKKTKPPPILKGSHPSFHTHESVVIKAETFRMDYWAWIFSLATRLILSAF